MNEIDCDIAESIETDPYDCYVTKLADARSAELISNGQIKHAQSIIRNLFLHAENEIRIFSTSLHSEIYRDPRVVDAASAFMAKPGSKLRILVQNSGKVDRDMPFFKLCSEKAEVCEMKEASRESDKSIKQHMVVMDSTGYRFCADMTKNEAIASFNAPDTASNLAVQFDVLFERAGELQTEAKAA